MTPEEKIKTVFDELEKHPFQILPKEDGPYTAQLVNESDPNGPVEFLDHKGVVRMMMPLQDYEDLIEYIEENRFND